MGDRNGLQCDVLLIEDDPLALALLDTLIKNRIGMSVCALSSVDEAMPLLRSAAAGESGILPKMIVVDWHLQNRNAAGFIAWVRMSTVMGHLPIYAISASDEPMIAQIAIDSGATQFCPKRDVLKKFGSWVTAEAA